MSEYSTENKKSKPDTSHFPKVKKILESSYESNIKVRRVFVDKIPENLFEDEAKMNEYLSKELETVR